RIVFKSSSILQWKHFQIAVEANNTLIAAEATIEEINEIDGVAEYLFQGDINLTDGAGCFATIGMAGGEQSLSLGNGCDSIGIAAHEFAHALGVWHTQMRDDRDTFLRVDLTSVPPNLLHNYIKLPASRIINYTPYEYGSYMHYDSRSFSTKGDSLIPLDSTYLRTLGSRIISFYDIKMLNDHYGCNARCTTGGTVCFNGGVPNPRNC
ncbi:Metalloendopeptidase, partial [Trichostrongylus colubriformis]